MYFQIYQNMLSEVCNGTITLIEAMHAISISFSSSSSSFPQIPWCYSVLTYACQEGVPVFRWANLQGHFQNQYQASSHLLVSIQYASGDVCVRGRRMGNRSLFADPSHVHVLFSLGDLQLHIPRNYYQEWGCRKYYRSNVALDTVYPLK